MRHHEGGGQRSLWSCTLSDSSPGKRSKEDLLPADCLLSFPAPPPPPQVRPLESPWHHYLHNSEVMEVELWLRKRAWPC